MHFEKFHVIKSCKVQHAKPSNFKFKTFYNISRILEVVLYLLLLWKVHSPIYSHYALMQIRSLMH